ncbi:MAG TPA: branched-chain amino acid ABC transporter permease [Methylomirabilota bacterium]|jgi:branched-chain amino acid transport system permease protein|nr:branched-chain amino acid ABC transporter permease [Methylomirabilota bacterium]
MLGLVSYLVFFAIVVLVFAIAVLGLNLQWGFTGLFNAGVVGFYAVGGYTLAILTAPPRPEFLGGLGLPFVVGLAVAMGTSAAAAFVIGLATIRLREDYLAIATFGVAVVIQLVALNFEALTGGNLGIAAIPRPLAGWFDSPFAYNGFYLALMAVAVGTVYWALERMVRSPWGRVLRAIREDETAAVSLGKDARRFRLQAFVLGSMLVGLAGALYVAFIGYVSPFDFLPIVTFQMWTMLIVGGSGSNRGAVLGAAIVWGLWSLSGSLVARYLPSELQTQGGALQVILIGLILVLTLLFRPRGLIGEAPIVSRHLEDH